jgi:nitronate monooxygenase
LSIPLNRRRRHLHRQRRRWSFLEHGAAAIQVATRFTVTDECGLPAETKQEYFKANEDDIEVNTDFAHRLPDAHAQELAGHRLRDPPGLRVLRLAARRQGQLRLHHRPTTARLALHPDGKNIKVMDKTCLCTHMRNFKCWTCGHYHLPAEGHQRACSPMAATRC